MHYDLKKHNRRSIRLKGYDYTQPGAYFITICTHGGKCLFGKIVNRDMILNDAGRTAEKCWQDIPKHFPYIELDEFIIMPNHIHGIIWVIGDVGAKNISPLRNKQNRPGTSKTIGSVDRGFKIGVTKWMRQNTTIHNVWQRNYYEHIIRTDESLNHIRQYIMLNPSQWSEDIENPHRTQSIK